MRICVVGALTVGLALIAFFGASHAAAQVGQTGYGAPQVLGEQFIKPQSASSSSAGLWIGIFIASAILAGTGFFGWRRVHNNADAA